MSGQNQVSLHFATNLKLLRKMRGLTQQSLANALEIKRSAVSTYESGFTEPRLLVLHKIATYFEVSIQQLISSPPDSIGLDQMLPDSDGTKIRETFLEHLKDFLNATTESQKIYEGLIEFDALARKVNDVQKDNFEATRLKRILKEILDNNWKVLEEIQMLD